MHSACPGGCGIGSEQRLGNDATTTFKKGQFFGAETASGDARRRSIHHPSATGYGHL